MRVVVLTADQRSSRSTRDLVPDTLTEIGAGALLPFERLLLNQMVDDLVQPVLEAVLVHADELQHVFRHGHLGVVGIHLEEGIRGVQLDDELLPEHEADRFASVD